MDKVVNAKLIDDIEQMKVDMTANDWTAIEGLLYGVAFEKLKSYTRGRRGRRRRAGALYPCRR
jgi:hypothetical protein